MVTLEQMLFCMILVIVVSAVSETASIARANSMTIHGTFNSLHVALVKMCMAMTIAIDASLFNAGVSEVAFMPLVTLVVGAIIIKTTRWYVNNERLKYIAEVGDPFEARFEDFIDKE